MKKRIVSLLMAAVMLLAAIAGACADEEDKYQAFVDKYGPWYTDIDWEQAIAGLGGLNNIDWARLVRLVGYEGNQRISWYSMEPTVSAMASYDTFRDIYSVISATVKEINDAHFASASDLVKKFCTTSNMSSYPLDLLDEYLDLVVNRLIPQAALLIRSRVPAFRDAAPGALSTDLGVGISTTSASSAGIIAQLQAIPSDRTTAGMQMYLYIKFWLKTAEDRTAALDRDDSAVGENNLTVIHETVHAFMHDYNRNGMVSLCTYNYVDGQLIFVTEDAGRLTNEEKEAKDAILLFPVWFMEGTATLLEGNYSSNFESTIAPNGLGSLDGTEPSCTADLVRQVYRSQAGSLTPKGYFEEFYADYIFSPPAVAWLCDMQWQADGNPPAFTLNGDSAFSAVNEAGVINGFSRILERLHNGEPLDDVIRRITGARFLDAEDFGRRFILGGDGGSDEGTAEFCSAWFNYLEALSRRKGYVVSGSLLAGLDADPKYMLDWSREATSPLYTPVSRGFVSSTASWEITGKTAGKSHYNVDTWREGAKYVCSEGADSEYVKGSGTPLPFVFERTVNPDAAFSHFTALEVNGGILTPGSQYNAASGSVKAELLPAYLDTLAPGAYKLTAVFDDEKAVTVNFTVQAQPGSFEAVAVPSGTFTFKKVWQGDSEKSIDFTLYKADGSVYHHGFDKKIVSKTEWRYNAWFSSPAACYVIEQPLDGYITHYENVGVYAGITDRCCDGGTIINKKIPKTGDSAPLALWAGMILLGASGIGTALIMGKRRKANK